MKAYEIIAIQDAYAILKLRMESLSDLYEFMNWIHSIAVETQFMQISQVPPRATTNIQNFAALAE